MLVLSRKKNEEIVIVSDGREVRIRIVQIDGGKVRLGLDAPKDVAIHREEVWARHLEFQDPHPGVPPTAASEVAVSAGS